MLTQGTNSCLQKVIYLFTHIRGASRTFKEICNLTKVKKTGSSWKLTSDIAKCYKSLKPLLTEPSGQVSLDASVYRFSSQMDLSSRVQQAAVKVLCPAHLVGE